MSCFTLLLLCAASAPWTGQVTPPEAEQCLGTFDTFDYDGDGLGDAVVCRAGELRVLRNTGQGRLADQTIALGLAHVRAVVARPGDFNRDSWPDLAVVAPDGTLRILVGSQAGFAQPSSSMANVKEIVDAQWFDYDRDGWTDLALQTRTGLVLLRNRLGSEFELAYSEPDDPLFPSDPAVVGLEATLIAPVREHGSESLVVTPTDCAATLRDGSAPLECIAVDSAGSIGSLFPLSNRFHVAPNGQVGVGIPAPTAKLHVGAGDVRLDEGRLELYESGARRATIDPTASNGARLRLFSQNASATVRLDAEDAANQGGVLQLLNRQGRTTTALLAGNPNQGGSVLLGTGGVVPTWKIEQPQGLGPVLRGCNDADRETVQLTNDMANGGALRLGDTAGAWKTSLTSASGAGGGLLELRASDTSRTVIMEGDVQGGGRIETGNEFSVVTSSLMGNASQGVAGELTLRDPSSGDTTVSLLSTSSGGRGGRLLLTREQSSNSILLEASFNLAASLVLSDDNGIPAMNMSGPFLALYDSSGIPTIAYQRETGTKNAVVRTENHGDRMLYKTESPEVWFEDFGSGELANGLATVELDPIYLETVTIDDAHPLRVVVTVTGPSPGVFVEKSSRGFTVRELSGGRGCATFDWRVAAKRTGLEDARLTPFLDGRSEDEVAAVGNFIQGSSPGALGDSPISAARSSGAAKDASARDKRRVMRSIVASARP